MLSVKEEEISELQGTVNSLAEALDEQASRKIDLIIEAEHAAVRAAMSNSGGVSVRLRQAAAARVVHRRPRRVRVRRRRAY